VPPAEITPTSALRPCSGQASTALVGAPDRRLWVHIDRLPRIPPSAPSWAKRNVAPPPPQRAQRRRSPGIPAAALERCAIHPFAANRRRPFRDGTCFVPPAEITPTSAKTALVGDPDRRLWVHIDRLPRIPPSAPSWAKLFRPAARDWRIGTLCSLRPP
jgi:hypothetical protein